MKTFRNRYNTASCYALVISVTTHQLKELKKQISHRYPNPHPTPDEQEKIAYLQGIINEYQEMLRHTLLIAQVCGPTEVLIRA